MEIKIFLHKENNGYWAEVPVLKGCVSEGDTIEETIENIKEAIKGWLTVDIPVKTLPTGNFEVLSVAI